MAEVAVTEKLDDMRPSDEQATAFLNGDRTAVEQQETQPQAKEKAEATAPAASTTPPVQTKSETEVLKQELNRIKSELGQLRKRGSESPKPTEQPTPQALAKLSPEQRAEWMALFEESFQSKYGEKFDRFEQREREAEIATHVQGIEAYAKTLTGDLHKELDPIMGEMYEELMEKANDGDEEAQQDLYEIKNTRAGIRDLVARARQKYSQDLAAKGETAKATQATQAKKAGVTLGSTPQAAPQPDILKNLPDDPAEAAAMLRKELIKRGAL